MSSPSSTGSVSAALAKDRLGVPAVVFFILSAVAPLTVVAGVVTTLYAVTGLVAIGAAFLVVAAVLAIFAAGYVAMARRITNAGAFYAFVSRGLGRPAGVGIALVAVVAYNLLQVGLYGMFGAQVADYVAGKGGPVVDWYWYSLAAWAIVTILGLMRVDLNGIVLAVLLTAEVAVVLVLTVGGLSKPADGIAFDSLNPADLRGAAGIGALLVTALLGFVGFEASAVFSEESKNPRRTVPIATYTSLAVIAVVYAAASWAMSVHYGTENVAATAGEMGPGMLFAMSTQTIGEIATVLFLSSLFAAMLSFHSAVGRYMFALGRERVLPRALGRTNLRTGAPRAASLTQSLIGLLVIVMYAVFGWDPVVQLFFWLGTTGGLGVLIMIITTAVAIIAFFARDPQGENVWRRIIAPVIALIFLIYMLYSGLSNFSQLLGVEPGATPAWALPSAYAAAAVIGLLYGFWLKAARQDVYRGIGLGANAVTGRAIIDEGQQHPFAPLGSR
ncbi:APC family permease [Luedemannella helvata]|uniref:APC family permease n=1 Tax=Luedemannella helvata TaxID=349315 RepID=A0ABN2JZQ0_9ACTN